MPKAAPGAGPGKLLMAVNLQACIGDSHQEGVSTRPHRLVHNLTSQCGLCSRAADDTDVPKAPCADYEGKAAALAASGRNVEVLSDPAVVLQRQRGWQRGTCSKQRLPWAERKLLACASSFRGHYEHSSAQPRM